MWLYLHLPQLQLDSLYVCADNQQAIVVLDSTTNQVLQLNDIAKSQGMTRGMGLATAASLCSNLHVIEYQSNIEQQHLEQLAHHCYQHIADIVLCPPQGLIFRLSPMLRLYKDVMSCWLAIKNLIEQVSPHYYLAIAHSPMAAQCLARQQAITQITNLALDDDRAKIKDQLTNVSLAATNLPKKSIDKLSRIGVDKLGSLLDIPLKELARRFDIDVVNTLGKITGQLRAPLSFYQPQDTFSYYLELHFDIQTTGLLEKPLQHLFGKLSHYLIARELVVKRLCLCLSLRDTPDISIEIDTAQGEQQQEKLIQLVQLKLERLTLNAPVTGLTLISNVLLAKQTISGNLFSPAVESSNQLTCEQLVSLLQAKLGQEGVERISQHPEHAPEQANRQQPIANESVEQHQYTCAGTTLLRPSYLLATPLPWHEPVTIVHGPERIDTQWWQPMPITRDYYIARNKQQQWCWLFKTPSGQWFIHGYFG